MNVSGTARTTRAGPTRTSASTARSRERRNVTPWRRAMSSTVSAPTLCLVCRYSSPGFPRPTTRRSALAPRRGGAPRRRNTFLPPFLGPLARAPCSGPLLGFGLRRRLALLGRGGRRALLALGDGLLDRHARRRHVHDQVFDLLVHGHLRRQG